MKEFNETLYKNHGIAGTCIHCNGTCEVIIPVQQIEPELSKFFGVQPTPETDRVYSISCMGCGTVWKHGNTLQIAIENAIGGVKRNDTINAIEKHTGS